MALCLSTNSWMLIHRSFAVANIGLIPIFAGKICSGLLAQNPHLLLNLQVLLVKSHCFPLSIHVFHVFGWSNPTFSLIQPFQAPIVRPANLRHRRRRRRRRRQRASSSVVSCVVTEQGLQLLRPDLSDLGKLHISCVYIYIYIYIYSIYRYILCDI